MKAITLRFLVITLLLLGFAFNFCYAQVQSNPSQKQVKFFFPGAKLNKDYTFNFPNKFKEVTVIAKDSTRLSAVLFMADSSKGVILYLHGNTDAINKWGMMAKTYTALGYDLFMLDYRGYGKSEGSIKNETQLYSDVQDAYKDRKSVV